MAKKRTEPKHQPRGEPPAEIGRFAEAVDAFRRRVPMTKDEWDTLDDTHREQAFTVAGVAQADLVTDVHDAIERAIEDGETLDDFKERVGDMLSEAWGAEDAARLETVFRTNVNSAYNAGRHAVFSAPAVKEARPYFRFEIIDDDHLDDEGICEDCDGVVLPQDDPWWATHTPPLHFNCRCSFSAISEEEAADEGGVDDDGPAAEADEGFGDEPSEDGADWDGPDEDRFPAAVGDVLRDVLR